MALDDLSPSGMTPGPWFVHDWPDRTCQITNGAGENGPYPEGQRVCDVWCTDMAEGAANARAIAAVPDLVALAERIARAPEGSMVDDIDRDLARAALLKARGEEEPRCPECGLPTDGPGVCEACRSFCAVCGLPLPEDGPCATGCGSDCADERRGREPCEEGGSDVG